MAKDPEHRFRSAEEFRSALGVTGEAVPMALPTPVPAASELEAGEVMRVESHLARAVGPIARHLVSKAVRRAASIDELCLLLAEQVSDVRERDEFLRSCTKAVATPASTKSPSTSSSGANRSGAHRERTLNPDMLEEARRKLAPFIGPIARILVDRTARKARTAEEFYSMLAAEIPSERDRASFVSSIAG
jgi:serine/threonine-protein kinase